MKIKSFMDNILDYRGEIIVIVHNNSIHNTLNIDRGTRIAQMVFGRFETAYFYGSETLTATQRGSGGLGSTGFA